MKVAGVGCIFPLSACRNYDNPGNWQWGFELFPTAANSRIVVNLFLNLLDGSGSG